jgi:RNA polymerase sigma factor (sigma-70 family)
VKSAQRKELVLTEYAQKLIRIKARQLRTRLDFRASDLDDLQQELWLAVCERIGRFDPAKASLETFIDLVVNQAVSSMLRRRQRLKRDKGTFIQSLDEPIPGCQENCTLAETASPKDLARRMGRHLRDLASDHAVAEALAFALAQMPKQLQDITRRLMDGTVNSVAVDLGMSRRAVRRACQEIKTFLETAGLGNC